MDEEGAQEDEPSGSEAALTLHGMVRRVARLAGETSWTRWSPVPCKALALRSCSQSSAGDVPCQVTIAESRPALHALLISTDIGQLMALAKSHLIFVMDVLPLDLQELTLCSSSLTM